MLSRKLLLPILAGGLAAYLYAPGTTYAQNVVDQPVWFTFANEVRVPGKTLEPGQYEFKNTSSKVDRQVIEIYNKSQSKPVAIVMAVGTSRTDLQGAPNKPEVIFYETPAGTPPPVQSFWYPGVKTGHAFIYSKAEAAEMASLNKTVYSEEAAVETPAPVAEARTETPAPRVETPAPAPVAVTPEPAPVTPPPAMETAAPRTTLPHTASNVSGVLVIGVLSLFAGFALFGRRRIA